jgi:Putative MetA-pathway of phenol degradation
MPAFTPASSEERALRALFDQFAPGVAYVDVDGFADPAFRLSMNFVGAPALTAAEFKNYRQDLIFGMSLRVTAPLGQYDAEKLVNIGTNRWSFKPEIGLSKAFGPWTVELAPGRHFLHG